MIEGEKGMLIQLITGGVDEIGKAREREEEEENWLEEMKKFEIGVKEHGCSVSAVVMMYEYRLLAGVVFNISDHYHHNR